MVSTITFALSGLVMIFLLVHKQIELSRGRGMVARNATKNSDKHVHHWYSEIRKWLLMVNTKNIVHWINMFFVVVARIVMDISKQVHALAHQTTEKLSHPKENLGDAGNASEYLKKISAMGTSDKPKETTSKE